MKNKLQNVKLIKVEIDTDVQYLNYEGWHFRGWATYRIGLIRKKVCFMYVEQAEFKIAYLDETGKNIPADRLQNEALLVLIYGEIGKYKCRQEQIQYFKQKRQEEEEERRKRTMKFLVNLEGEFPHIIEGENKLNEFLENEAKERREHGCDNVDKWLEEMKEQKFSQVYTNYPEIIVNLDDYVVM